MEGVPNNMKKIFNWQVLLALILVTLSFSFYMLDYILFGQLKDIIFYGIIDLAFLFLSGLIVMLFLNRLLEYREKQSLLKKLNMVIGTFFSEVGTDLLKQCAGYENNKKELYSGLIISGSWNEKDFLTAKNMITVPEIQIKCNEKGLEKLKVFLVERRPFLLSLLANPNLLEHEAFTDLLWAVFHLTEELEHRSTFNGLPAGDYKHLFGDINRAYTRLILQWLDYMAHLKRAYPYLFSLALRRNPFDKQADVIIK